MIHSRTAEPIADCALSHHFPGRPVTWSAYSDAHHRMVVETGIVLEHRAATREIRLRSHDGREQWRSCGPVAAWGADR